MPIVNREPLVEKQDYDAMLNDIRKIIYGRPFIPQATREVSMEGLERAARSIAQKYKRNDLVVWLIRILKIKHITVRRCFVIDYGFSTSLSSLGLTPDEREQRVKYVEFKEFPFIREWLRQNDLPIDEHSALRLTGFSDIEVIERSIDHYLSLPIPAIQNYRFGWQTEHAVFEEFQRHEEIWKEENKGLIPFDPDNESTFLKLADGYEWVLLPREYCHKEGKAMGHCGNAGSPQPGDRILSLRQRAPNGWRVCLTFILDKNAKLGEMKGRGNDKPAPRYHPQIKALLMDSRIKGIKGGGYLADHNFDLTDLAPEDREGILEQRPELATLKVLGDLKGFDSPVVKDRILEAMNDVAGQGQDFEMTISPDDIRYSSINNIMHHYNYGSKVASGDMSAMGNETQKHMLKRLEAFLMLGMSDTTDKELADRIWKIMPRDKKEVYKTPELFLKSYSKTGKLTHGVEEFFNDIYGPALVLGYWKDVRSKLEEMRLEDLQISIEKSGTPVLQWSLPVRFSIHLGNINSKKPAVVGAKGYYTPTEVAHGINSSRFWVNAQMNKARTRLALDKAPAALIEHFVGMCFEKEQWVSLGHMVTMKFNPKFGVKTWDDWSQDHYLDGVDAKYIREKLESL